MKGKGEALITLLLITFLFSASIPVKAQPSCNIPSDYPDVNTALANGCYQINFDGNVIEVNQIILDSASTTFDTILLNGNGFKWILNISATPGATFINFRNLTIYNLTIIMNVSGTNIFLNNTNTSIYDVEIFIEKNSTALFTVDSDVYLNNLFVDNPFGGKLINAYMNFDRLYITNLDLQGPLDALTMVSIVYNTSTISISNSSIDGRIYTRLLPTLVDDPSNSYIEFNRLVLTCSYYRCIYVDLNGENSTYSVLDSVVNIIPSTSSVWASYTDITRMTPAPKVIFKNVVVHGNDYSWGVSTVGIAYSISTYNLGDLQMFLDSVYISNVDYGIVGTVYVTTPILYEEHLGTVEIVITNSIVDSWLMANYFLTPIASDNFIRIENSSFSSYYGNAFTFLSYRFLNISLINVNTSSRLSDLYLVYSGIYTFAGTPSLDDFKVYTYRWFTSNESWTSDVSIETYTLDNQRITLEVTYSLLKKFNLMGNVSALFNETVYQEIGSSVFGSIDIRSIWTLDIQVLSELNGGPVPNVRVDLYRYGLIGYGYTGLDGHTYILLNYSLDVDNPFIRDLVIGVDLPYFSGRWGYHTTFGYNITLPSWYGYIVIRIPALYVAALGHMYHKPIIIEISGGKGYIHQFVTASDLIKHVFFGVGSPIKTISFDVLELHNYQVYIMLKVRIYHYPPGEIVTQYIYINLLSRTIYSPGPYKIIAKY